MKVYFVSQGERGPIKIGFAKDVDKRVRALQTASPVPLKVLAVVEGDSAIEKRFHRLLEAHRLMGEWFERSAPVVDVVENVERVLADIHREIEEESSDEKKWASRGEAARDWAKILEFVGDSQAEQAEILGVHQPRISAKVRGVAKVSAFEAFLLRVIIAQIEHDKGRCIRRVIKS